MKTHCGLKLHFGQYDRSETCTEVSFTTPEVMRTLIMKLSHTEVKLYSEVKYQTGLSSLWVWWKRVLINLVLISTCYTFNFHFYLQTNVGAFGKPAPSPTYMQTRQKTAISTTLHPPKVLEHLLMNFIPVSNLRPWKTFSITSLIFIKTINSQWRKTVIVKYHFLILYCSKIMERSLCWCRRPTNTGQ